MSRFFLVPTACDLALSSGFNLSSTAGLKHRASQFNGPLIRLLIETLEKQSLEAIKWFNLNGMIANPDKFQAILLTPHRSESLQETIHIGNTEIQTEHEVNILGVNVDDRLTFKAGTRSILLYYSV